MTRTSTAEVLNQLTETNKARIGPEKVSGGITEIREHEAIEELSMEEAYSYLRREFPEYMEQLQDEIDYEISHRAIGEAKSHGTISLEDAKKELGL